MQEDRTSRAIYHSILGMLGVPLVMLGGLVSLIVVNNRARGRANGPSGSGDAGSLPDEAP